MKHEEGPVSRLQGGSAAQARSGPRPFSCPETPPGTTYAHGAGLVAGQLSQEKVFSRGQQGPCCSDGTGVRMPWWAGWADDEAMS